MKGLLRRDNLIYLSVCLFLILYSFLIDQRIRSTDFGIAAPDLVLPIFLNEYSREFFLNLAFAILIARIVYITVQLAESLEREEANRRFLLAQENFVKETVDDISRNTFRGIFGAGYPAEYIDEMIQTVLTRPLYRHGYRAVYRLREKEGCSGTVLNISVYYRTKNYGKREERVTPGLELSAVKTAEYKMYTKVYYVKIRGVNEFVDQVPADFKKQLDDSSTNEISIRFDEIVLKPEEEFDYEISYDVYKGSDDNEVMQSLLPTDGFEVLVFDETSKGKEFGARAIHRMKMRRDDTGSGARDARWLLDRPSLPHSGYVVYWN